MHPFQPNHSNLAQIINLLSSSLQPQIQFFRIKGSLGHRHAYQISAIEVVKIERIVSKGKLIIVLPEQRKILLDRKIEQQLGEDREALIQEISEEEYSVETFDGEEELQKLLEQFESDQEVSSEQESSELTSTPEAEITGVVDAQETTKTQATQREASETNSPTAPKQMVLEATLISIRQAEKKRAKRRKEAQISQKEQEKEDQRKKAIKEDVKKQQNRKDAVREVEGVPPKNPTTRKRQQKGE